LTYKLILHFTRIPIFQALDFTLNSIVFIFLAVRLRAKLFLTQ